MNNKILLLIHLLLLLTTLASLAFSQSVDSLRYYEKQFNPSIYDIKTLVLPKNFFVDKNDKPISGYRVQILATDRLDSANTVKSLLQNLLKSSHFKNQEVYIIYEPPNYKVRVGDFEHLQDASILQKFLINNGFPHAWIVNDAIRKNY